MRNWIRILPGIFVLISLASSCASIRKSAISMIADTLSGPGKGANVFASDNDPELIADALPFALKLYETLLKETPDNANLHLATGSAFIMYANAFIQAPAEMLSDREFEKQRKMLLRAKNLYIRGRDYILQGIELRHQGFKAALDSDSLNMHLENMTNKDVPFLYWASAGWLGAYSIDVLDIDLGATIRYPVAMLQKAMKLEEEFDKGSIHELFISYYGALPASMGGSEKKARYHFKRAIELSGGKKASPYVALATTVSVKNQNKKEFKHLLGKALALDPEEKPEYRLMNIIAQQKARWLLEHVEDKFLTDGK